MGGACDRNHGKSKVVMAQDETRIVEAWRAADHWQ